MTKKINQASILTAMITPFDEKGALAMEKVSDVVNYLLEHHTEGIVVGGTTGESPTLSEEEKIDLYKETIRVVAGRVPVICGVGSNDTRASISFIKKVAQLEGVAAGLCVVPFYNKPSQEGLYQHFKALSEASDLPIILYNVPGRTGVNMSVETTLRLEKLPNIIGTKECQGLEAFTQIVKNVSDDFLVYSGEDHLALPCKLIGGAGIISVSSHIVGDKMYEMYQALENKEIEEAATIHQELNPVFDAVFSAPSPAPVKAIYNEWGLDVGEPRLPLVSCNNEEIVRIMTEINQVVKK